MTKRTRSTSGGTRTEGRPLWRPVRRRKAPRGRHRYRPANHVPIRANRSGCAGGDRGADQIDRRGGPTGGRLPRNRQCRRDRRTGDQRRRRGVAEDRRTTSTSSDTTHRRRFRRSDSRRDRTRTSDERADGRVVLCLDDRVSGGFSSADNSGSTARPIAGIVHIRCAERTCAIDGRPG